MEPLAADMVLLLPAPINPLVPVIILQRPPAIIENLLLVPTIPTTSLQRPENIPLKKTPAFKLPLIILYWPPPIILCPAEPITQFWLPPEIVIPLLPLLASILLLLPPPIVAPDPKQSVLLFPPAIVPK